ncbi:MAG: hypothetical protein IH991_17130 [Planctomycetes bacterium]|nr:hypothetical protein [Planctomycetota bacterium]
MILCPIAIAASCKKCPAFSFCPVKTVIGDYMKEKKRKPSSKSDDEKK